MSQNVTFNGQVYVIPDLADNNWGQNVTDYLVALPQGALQKTAGAFTLAADVDFGASFGLKSAYFKTRASNPASAGLVRLANTDTVVWRNAGNSGDLALAVNGSNQLTFNGVILESDVLPSAYIFVGNASNESTGVPMTGDIGIDNTGLTSIQNGVIINTDINASAAIAYSKLAALTASRMLVSDGSGVVSVATWGWTGGIMTTNSNGALRFTDGTTNYVEFVSPASVTTHTYLLPIAAGLNGQVLSWTTGGQLAWINASGTGTINSGTAGRFAYYPGTGTTLSDQALLTTDGTNLTLTSGQILLPAGSVSAPSAVFGGFTGTGIYSYGTNIIGFASNGNPMMRITTTAVRVSDGAISAPGLSMWGNPSAGLYYSVGSGIRIAQNNIDQISCTDAGVYIYAHAGSQTNPSYTFGGDLNSGMYSFGSDVLGWSVNGTNLMWLSTSELRSLQDINAYVAKSAAELVIGASNRSTTSDGNTTGRVYAEHNNGTYSASTSIVGWMDGSNNRNCEVWMTGVPVIQGDAAGGVAEMKLKINVYDSVLVNAIDIAKTGVCTFPQPIVEPQVTSLKQNVNNLLVNGGFRVWNEGVDFTNPASTTELADGWVIYKAGTSVPNVDFARNYTQQESGPYCFAIQCIGAGSGLTDGVRIYQGIVVEKRMMGKYLTVTARIKTSTANKYRVGVGLGASTTYSSYHTGSGNYETLTASKLINHATNGISVEFGMLQSGDVATSIAYIDNVMLTIGETAIDYASEGYGIAITKASFRDFLTYRRPDLSWASITEIGVEPNTYRLGATEIVVMFPDGEMRRILGSDTNLRRMNITETAANTGTLNSGLRSGLSEAANTWYAIYAWKSIDNDGKFVLVGDTTPPAVNNYSTLNTRYGLDSWVFLGYVRNGMNAFGGSGQDLDLIRFVQFGGITLFPWSIGSRYPFGTVLASTTGNTLTYTPTTGMGASDLPDTVGHVKWGTQVSGSGGGTGFSVTSGVSASNGFMFEDSSKASTAYMGAEVWNPRTYGCEVKNSGGQAMTITCAGFTDIALTNESCPLR